MSIRTVPRCWALGVPLVMALGLSACGDDECSAPGDCPSNQICEEGVCVDEPFIPPRPGRDGGPIDTGTSTPTPDAGPMDTGTSTAADGGVDGGIDGGFDGGLDGAVDAGDSGMSGLDGGPVDAADGGVTQESIGYVVLGEYRPGSSTFGHVAEAKFYDGAASGLTTATTLYSGQGVDCELRRMTFASAVTGPTAGSIEITGLGVGQPAVVSLTPGSNAWELSTNQAFSQGIFADAADGLDFDVVAGANGLATYSTSLFPPSEFVPQIVQPLLGSAIFATAPISINWIDGHQFSSQPIYVELASADRFTVLSCVTSEDNGQLDVPEAARAGFLAAAPAQPAVLEVQYKSETRETVPVMGGGAGVVTDFRLSAAVRYNLQF